VYNSTETDDVLIESVKKGDADAYKPLVERYKLPLYTVMYRMVRHRDDAEDLVEEAFIKGYRAIKSFETGRPFFAWLCKIAVNNAINFLKKERRDKMQPIGQVEHALRAKQGDPVQMTEQKLLQERIAAAMAKLDDADRTILILRIDKEFSYDEIAGIMKIPRGTVMSRLSRARQKLRKIFENKEEEDQ
jgi:RNA polymerase sigma-70 factor (ECF subfamily)